MGLPISFIDYSSSFMMARIEAEIYMRIYQYAAEDFRATSDCVYAHERIVAWQNQTEMEALNYAGQVSAHTHICPEGVSSPPLPYPYYRYTPPALLPVNTTGRFDNILANVAIPMPNLSYIDLSFRSINVPVSNFRRGLMIPWAYGPVSLALKIE